MSITRVGTALYPKSRADAGSVTFLRGEISPSPFEGVERLRAVGSALIGLQQDPLLGNELSTKEPMEEP